MVLFLTIFIPVSVIVAFLLFRIEKKDGYLYHLKNKIFNTNWTKGLLIILIIELIISSIILSFLGGKLTFVLGVINGLITGIVAFMTTKRML